MVKLLLTGLHSLLGIEANESAFPPAWQSVLQRITMEVILLISGCHNATQQHRPGAETTHIRFSLSWALPGPGESLLPSLQTTVFSTCPHRVEGGNSGLSLLVRKRIHDPHDFIYP